MPKKMATSTSFTFKPKNSKKNKHQKRKNKRIKIESIDFDSYAPRQGAKALNNADINSFWKYSPRNPFTSPKNEKTDSTKHVSISTTSTISKHELPFVPYFNSISPGGNMSSILTRRENDNTTAVNEARREIEKIKTELETLINANIKTQSFYTESMNLISPEIETLLNTAADACNTLDATPPPATNSPVKTSPVKPPIIKTSVKSPKTNRKKNLPLVTEEALIEQIRPKLRTYDPEKTREFIKKQKLRRKEKVLEEEQKKQQLEFARKNKLEELKKKTMELVTKNLKKSTITKSDVTKSNAQIDTKTTVNKCLHPSRRCRARSFDNENRGFVKDKEIIDNNKRSRSVSKENIKKQTEQKINPATIPSENQTSAVTKSQQNLQSNLQKNHTAPKINKPIQIQNKENNQTSEHSNIKNKIEIDLHQISPKTIESTEKTIEYPVKQTIESPIIKQTIDAPKQSNDQIVSIDKECENNAAKELTEIKQKLETSITQIKEKKDTPEWLQPPSSVPYPYNFISAVRKKLEYVTRKQPTHQPDKIDENKLNVSIQCSIDKKILDVNSVNIPKLVSPDFIEKLETTRNKQETTRNKLETSKIKLESPKYKSYDSHKCRRQLYPNININIPIKNSKESDSDSDTTKHIPELPHESQSISKNQLKNITFERNIPSKLNIGLIKLPEYSGLIPPNDKIEIAKNSNKKLEKLKKNRSKYPEDIDSILSHYSKIKSEHNSYSDDFNSVSTSGSSKPEKTESVTEYKEIPSGFLTKSSISEHLTQDFSKENVKENETVSTETNVTMKGIPSLAEQSNGTIGTTIKSPTIIDKNPTTIDKTQNVVDSTIKGVPSVSQQSNGTIGTNTISTTINSVDKNPTTIKSDSFAEQPKNDFFLEIRELKKPETKLKRRTEDFENNPNQIHLKLQAEVHLLNSFNNSLKQVVSVEKSVFDVPSTSNTKFNPINCKRGCDYFENNDSNSNLKSFKDLIDDEASVCSQDLGISNIIDIDRSSISTIATTNTNTNTNCISISKQREREENLNFKNHPYVTISLDMVDQMIKDEDIRLEHLKAVLKLREQALFDRIKGELALLEIRKRELREHGSTNDITAIKKKQRGLIIKLQQERHEMHRLKTAHKQAAKARKTALHEQKSIIKTQLSSTDQIPKKLRRLSQVERPSLGPVKVYRVDSRTEISETTLSRKGSDDSVTNSSVLTHISEKISVEKSEIYYSDSLVVVEPKQSSSVQSEKLKRSLLMKEAEIDKRRKEIEQLIKWQKRLKQKEAEVVELERQAVKSLQSDDHQEKVRIFTGAHLNKVWKGIALSNDKNFDEQKKYQMSKRSLDKFYQNARKMFKEVSDEEKRSKSESYSSEFEQTNSTSRLDLEKSVTSLNEVEVQTKMVADRLRHISDIISVPDISSEDVSSIKEDTDKSVSVSESQSVKTEVNTLIRSDLSEPSKIQSDILVNNNSLSEKKTNIEDSLNSSSRKTISKSLELLIATENSQKPETDSLEFQITESLQNFDKTVSEISDSLDVEEEQPQSENSSSISEASEKSIPLYSSIKSEIKSKIIEGVSENSSPLAQKSISEVSEKSVPQVLDSLNSSIKSEIKYDPESEPQIQENVDSLNSSIKSEIKYDPKSISEPETEPQIQENVDSLNSSTKSETNIILHQIEEDIVSAKSETNIIPHIEEDIISAKSETENDSSSSKSISELEQTPEKSTTQAQIISEEWEPQLISEIKSDSSENKSEIVEISPKKSNTQSKTNSETHVSEENLQTDITTPRSEFQYETDFDKLSESDQSKIETESNISLKETNVDSSVNDDESEDIQSENKITENQLELIEIEEIVDDSESSIHSNTVKVSPKIISEKLEENSEISDKTFEKSECSHEEEEIENEDLNDSKKGVSHIDVRKRVSEILADANANGPRGDKSPRVQDLYTTTYDIAGSSESTPDSGSPTNEFSKPEKTTFIQETPYINEAEELLRKQLEIEQEIKRLERQQQNIPYLFMREIPNKPPPPYKPPDFPLTPVIASIIPTKPEQTKKIINESTDILFSAYSTGDLTITSSTSKDDQQRFMFDLCKEIALEACKPTIETKVPSWRSEKNKFQNLFAKRPITKDILNKVLNKKVLQLLNFEPVTRNDSLIIRWSRKKRDHVDEILVSETQAEETEWTNFDSDEEIIKDNLTQNILDLLIVDAAKDVNDVLCKKKTFSWIHC